MRVLQVVCLLFAATPAFAQSFSFGLVGGASLTQDFQNWIDSQGQGPPFIGYSSPKRWIAGATAEAHLPWHLAVEVDALYHEIEYTNASIEPNGTLNSVSPAPVVTWEFPILVKYRFSLPVVKPFVEAGPAFRSAGNLNGTTPSNHGVAAGLGAEVHLWKVKIAPQFRYIRWAADPRFPYPFSLFQSRTVSDQVEFLTSLTFDLHYRKR